ncbi:threonine aldolase [Niastella yeongjuensis]|uniref:Threonine aldolase n=1 Tax=Niastella yeongjuensis TaxID=354355 RepID=A0A1V9DY03_9BACT|nr:D-TA family PLP-dependent enzyme [Niastella yeongjuensis]OQP38711.1 threonine aldolase [Niastella yeongjuensis]SEO35432.1 D-serine deaminase, pyridoxal phosphate-dependent [Niastella yeongjuensis]
MENNWYLIEDIDKLDTPALVIFPERVKANINTLKAMIDDPQRLRPHAKTHKTKEATQLMLAAGITKFKCATIAEAEMLGMCGAPDVVLAYQPVGPKLERFVKVTQQYPNTFYSCLVDNIPSASAIGEAFAAVGAAIAVYIDLNVGQNRTGITPGEKAIELYKYCANTKGLSIAGLHAYDGHTRGTLAERTAQSNEAYAKVEDLLQALQSTGYPNIKVIAGGSPSFPIHAKRGQVECSPGTFIFWDKSYQDQNTEQPFQIAAIVVTRVVSLPNDTHICVDLGHKSIAAENELSKRVFFINAPELKAISHSEEHLVLQAGEGHSYKPGDVLYGIPIHVCPTVALHERGYTVENGKLSDEWKIIARDRKISL